MRKINMDHEYPQPIPGDYCHVCGAQRVMFMDTLLCPNCDNGVIADLRFDSEMIRNKKVE